MKFKYLIFACFLAVSFVSKGQDSYSMLPSLLPERLLGGFINEEGELQLIVSKDYLVIESQLYFFNEIVVDGDSYNITAVHNFDVKYFSLITRNSDVFLDESYKLTKLRKIIAPNSSVFPKQMQGRWISDNNLIEIWEDSLVYLNETYQLDNLISTAENKYFFILYEGGKYYLSNLEEIQDKAHITIYLEEPLLLQKETFFQRHKTLIIIFLGLLLMFAIFLGIRWKMRTTQKRESIKRKLIETQLRGIRSQMNPHFLFNALSAIQNLINKGHNDKANHYLTEFSLLMRSTLEKTEKGLVPLADEIESIKKYLELEKLRFNFEYNIKVAHCIDMYLTEIPAMLIQPFVENSIIHGLKESDGKKILEIVFNTEGEDLICTIDDNGVGINAAKKGKKKTYQRNGFGIKLAHDRISMINESHKTNSKVVIEDKSMNNKGITGTLVKVSIPLKY
ncbi:MAG: histidine kinase [Flavobacteriaceae bacterium]